MGIDTVEEAMAGTSLVEKAERLRKLHVPGRPLVLPNVWDAGSAKIVAAEGFPAVATTSAGIAFAYGVPDGEAGYGPEPQNVAYTVMELLGAGVVGANFEDSSDAHADGRLFDLDLATARIAAGRKAAEAAGVPFVINGRTDALMRIKDPAAAFAEAVRRLNAYRLAGADCLFAPFTADPDVIGRLVKAVAGPLNIILQPTITVPEMARLGVARISLGGHLARAALAVARRAARELKERGTAEFAKEGLDYRELQKLMASRP
jgi:2-methylisocitrate lyase-like PEP mutase family enzyme